MPEGKVPEKKAPSRQPIQRRNTLTNLFKNKEEAERLEQLRQMAEKEDQNVPKLKRRSSISLFFKREEAKEETLSELPGIAV